MSFTMFWKLFIVLLSVLIFQSSFALRNIHSHKLEMYIDRTIKSLENVVDFYENNVDKVNLDSIYGLRVAQGGLASILKTLSVDHCNSLCQKLNSLHNTMKNAAEKALPYLKEYQHDYYNQFKPIVEKPWRMFGGFRRMEKTTTLSKGEQFKQHFDEKISDKCMTEMTGTNAHSKSPCYVSLDCLKLMTNNKLRRYGNTHQILYFLIGFETGCRHMVEKEFQKFHGYLKKNDILNVDKFLEKKCEQIFVEMKELSENVVANGDTDLFMEQGLVCGILGYENFLDRKTLENIFIWQDKEHGCFGKENSNFQEHDATQFVSRITMRKILYDRTLDNGCSSHETGVATGLLSVYLRWLLLRQPELN